MNGCHHWCRAALCEACANNFRFSDASSKCTSHRRRCQTSARATATSGILLCMVRHICTKNICDGIQIMYIARRYVTLYRIHFQSSNLTCCRHIRTSSEPIAFSHRIHADDGFSSLHTLLFFMNAMHHIYLIKRDGWRQEGWNWFDCQTKPHRMCGVWCVVCVCVWLVVRRVWQTTNECHYMPRKSTIASIQAAITRIAIVAESKCGSTDSSARR